MTNPLISIIVPNYNHSDFLEPRFESIFAQTITDFEIIILDDNSTDNSVEILKKYSSHPKVSHFLVNNKNTGSPFQQWEKGLGLAKGEFVWIAESDDYSEKNFLEELIKLYKNNPDIAIAYCQSYQLSSRGEITGNWSYFTKFKGLPFAQDFVMDGNLFIEKFLIDKNVIPNVSAVLFKRSQFDLIRPLKQTYFFRYNADWFFYIQLLCNSSIAFCAEPLNYFRYHNNSVIAKAGQENELISLYQMELGGRKEIFQFLKNLNLKNISSIRKQYKIGNEKLYYLMSKGEVDKGNFFRGGEIVFRRPILLWKVVKYMLRKFF